jgi:hypothetical protein
MMTNVQVNHNKVCLLVIFAGGIFTDLSHLAWLEANVFPKHLYPNRTLLLLLHPDVFSTDLYPEWEKYRRRSGKGGRSHVGHMLGT